MNVGKQGRTRLSRESLARRKREISALTLSPRKAIKHHDNNTRRVHKAADRPRKLNTYPCDRGNSCRQTDDRIPGSPFRAPLPRVRPRRNRRFNEKCAISRARPLRSPHPLPEYKGQSRARRRGSHYRR